MKVITFKDYQKESKKTVVFDKYIPKNIPPFIFLVLGLTGEAGEVAEKIKKMLRNDCGKIDDDFLQAIKLELGDVLWYISQICTELNIDLEEVANLNIEKIFRRKKNNTIRSQGDNR